MPTIELNGLAKHLAKRINAPAEQAGKVLAHYQGLVTNYTTLHDNAKATACTELTDRLREAGAMGPNVQVNAIDVSQDGNTVTITTGPVP